MRKSSKPISPLRQRMIDDMTMRNLKPATQTGYVRAVRRLNEFLGFSPDKANAEDLRLFQLHLSEIGTSAGTINATVSGLRFFFETTLSKPEIVKKITAVHEPRRLPVIPSREEVASLIENAGSLKYKAAFSIAYGAGLRTNEITHLKVNDIDSDRMVLRVDEGKYSNSCASGTAMLMHNVRCYPADGCFQDRILSIPCLTDSSIEQSILPAAMLE